MCVCVCPLCPLPGWDDPTVVPEANFRTDEGCAGLGLCPEPCSLFPHFDARLHAELVAKHAGELDHPVVCLADEPSAVDSGVVVIGDDV